ncbi:MAG: ATP-dependent DNA helicase RecQ [Bdellovibrionales bacterium]|nr:ATP-dependent DNA helicase RecQ [Bdellovibrionales bacterium]
MTEFRLGQREIIESALKGHDVLALMPTGGGKSLCFQLPALMGTGLTIVVSPLIALMNDQVASLTRLGIPAGCIHSGMSEQERRSVFHAMAENKYYLLYLSPERIQKPGFAAWLARQKVNLYAIDEAHCVSHWGHDFRTEYAELKLLREIHPDVPIMALTATATPLVKDDIIKQLNLKKPDQHVYGFYRPNLYYQVEFCENEADKESFVLSALSKTPTGRVIIYCGTRKKTEEWAQLLARQGEKVAFYHAGMSSDERTKMESAYQSGKVRVLAATNAFGMGIDHPDVRLVVHTQMPGNIESYYQEVGRAGRDGKHSTCLLTYSKKDKGLQSFFITNSEASAKIKAQRWSALNAMVQYAEGSECRHGDILTY